MKKKVLIIFICMLFNAYLFTQTFNLIGKRVTDGDTEEEKIEELRKKKNEIKKDKNKILRIVKAFTKIENEDLFDREFANLKKNKELLEKLNELYLAKDIDKFNTIKDNFSKLVRKYFENIEEVSKVRVELKNIRDQKKGSIALPFGASGAKALSEEKNDSSAGVGLGLQYSKEDSFFLSIMFNYAGEMKLENVKSSFGTFILNPYSEGTSFIFSGSQHLIRNKRLAIAFRLSITPTLWSVTKDSETIENEGVIFYIVPSIQFISKTHRFSGNSDGGTGNFFQWGFEVGPSLRFIAGDLGHLASEDFLKSTDVLGTDRAFYLGIETTFFLRLNSLRPYVRVSFIGKMKPKGATDRVEINGLTGIQVLFGVDVLSAFFKSTLN